MKGGKMFDQILVKVKTAIFVTTFLLTGVINPLVVTAAPVELSYTVTGSPGDWTLDFSVANNYPNTFVFQFHTLVNWGGDVPSPANWHPSSIPVSFEQYGASSTVYNLSWYNKEFNPPLIGSGQTLSGFQAHVVDQQAPFRVAWLAWAYSPDPIFPNLPCVVTCVYSEPQQIVFESVALPSQLQPVPVPAAFVLFGGGLGSLAGLAGWQRWRLR